MDVLLRHTIGSSFSLEEVLEFLRAIKTARVISHNGPNILASVEKADVPMLQNRLSGWIVSPQSERIPVPDTRIKIRL